MAREKKVPLYFILNLIFIYGSKTQAAQARGGGGEENLEGEPSAYGCPRTRKGNSIFTSISVIYVLGDLPLLYFSDPDSKM